MRCSSSEHRLDAYVGGTLGPRDRARVTAHVVGCAHCTSLLEELRVIDALLLQPRTLEPAANFTFKVMAEVRSLPQPHVHRIPTLAVLGTYVVFAWAIVGASFVFARGSMLATLATLGAWAARTSAAATAIAHATGHVFGRQTFDVTAAMSGVLAADVLAAGAVFALYAAVRARRVAAARADVC